jgi:RND family efflux transporter MFP subunit
MTSPSIPPTVDQTPPPQRLPRKASPLGRAVVALLVVGLAVPVGFRVKTALAVKKTMDEDRVKTAQAAAEKAAAPVTAKVTKGKPESWQPSVPFDGTLHPIREAMLAFKATGPMTAIKVKVGDFVEKGAILASLDATEASAQARAASAQIKAAQAQLALAEDNSKRTEAMVKGGSAPEIQATQAKGQLDLTAAQLESAQAQLALAGAMIRNHTLAAPFSGWVTQAPTGLGGLAAAGQPLFQLKDVSKLRLVGTVSELDVSLVKVGADVSLRVEGRAEPVAAKVSAVLPSVDPATRRIPVEAELENDPKSPLLAGTFVRASIAGGSALSVLRLPADALRPGAQDEVMVVEKGKLRAAKLLFTRAPDGALLVRSGLSADDAVFLSPPPEAKTGDPVTVAE